MSEISFGSLHRPSHFSITDMLLPGYFVGEVEDFNQTNPPYGMFYYLSAKWFNNLHNKNPGNKAYALHIYSERD